MTPTRKHERQIELRASPERLFQILHTPSAIRKWWMAERAVVVAKPGGLWAAAWGPEDDPDYVSAATIRVFDPPRRMLLTDTLYFAKQGQPPFEARMTLDFIVEPHPRGSLLKVIQDGFPAESIADEFYAACEVGWKNTLESIRTFVEQL